MILDEGEVARDVVVVDVRLRRRQLRVQREVGHPLA